MHCGAAARTRLAASPSWKPAVLTLAVLAALSLGVLAAALVTLAGGPGRSTQAPARTTVTTAPTVTATPTATAPTTSTPGTGLTGTSTLPRTTTPGTTTAPGEKNPGASLTGARTTPRPKTSSTGASGRTTPSVTTPTSNPLFTPTPKR